MTTDAARMNRQIGNYDLIVKIAEGGMGAVYKGRNRATGEIVAIKIVPADTARNPLLLKRFEQEFKAASVIDHPNVVKAIDYCGTGATPFLVMEFVDGESLGQRIERDSVLPESEAIRLIGQVCEGLHRAHKQGLIHRDVKPDNILLTQEGVAKLTDLGLVKDVEGEMNLTKTGRGLGTPHFMAPEQFRNAKNADVRCDMYSLGATLYMMVTGITPFEKTSPLDCWLKKTKNDFPEPKKYNPKLSDRTNWAICRAMHSDPAKRPLSCREFMEDLMGTTWRTQQGSGTYAVPPELQQGGVAAPVEDNWYMVYRDVDNQLHTVKGSTESIRKNLQAGVLGDITWVLVSRTKTGQFQPLRSIPEFRDLVVQTHGSGSEALANPRLSETTFNPPNSAQSRTPSSGPGTARISAGTAAKPPSRTPSTLGSKNTPISTTDYTPVKIPIPADQLPTEYHELDPITRLLEGSHAPLKTPAAPPQPPIDWTPYIVLGFAVVAAIFGLVFFLR